MDGQEIKEEVHIGIPIHNGMNLYPGIKGHERPVEVARLLKREVDGVEVPIVTKTPLNGTYIETGRHIHESGVHPIDILHERGKKVRQRMFDEYIAVVVHVKTKPGGEIKLEDVKEKLELVKPGYAFIINTIIEENGLEGGYTDWWLNETDGLIGQKSYNDESPHFSEELMKEIIKKKVSLLGGSNPSFTKVPEEKGFSTDMLKIFYTNNNMILAPLVNLGEVKQDIVVLKLCPERFIGLCPVNAFPVIYQGKLGEAHMERLKKFYAPNQDF